MPIDHKATSDVFSQRKQYQKGKVGRWYWDFRDRMMMSFIKAEDKKILDIGCGEGVTLEKLIRQFPEKRIKGIDIIPENVEICRKNGLPVELGTVYNLKNDKGEVDLCFLSEVIEHLENVDLALDNISRILKPSGRVVIVIPRDLNFKLVRLLFLRFSDAFSERGHINKFNPKKMKALLERKGFEVEKTINIPCYFWFFSLHSVMAAKKI